LYPACSSCLSTASATATGAVEKKAKREMHLSEGGKWKSFPDAPNLLQDVSAGTYFARVKVDGKVICQSLAEFVLVLL
jgi:hypothetical protein